MSLILGWLVGGRRASSIAALRWSCTRMTGACFLPICRPCECVRVRTGCGHRILCGPRVTLNGQETSVAEGNTAPLRHCCSNADALQPGVVTCTSLNPARLATCTSLNPHYWVRSPPSQANDFTDRGAPPAVLVRRLEQIIPPISNLQRSSSVWPVYLTLSLQRSSWGANVCEISARLSLTADGIVDRGGAVTVISVVLTRLLTVLNGLDEHV